MVDPFLCVYGHTNLDQIITLERFPERNTSVNVKERRLHYGGTGANVATMAAALGVPVALVSYVGPDLPPDFRALMLRHGVDLTDLTVLPEEDTPTVWVVTDNRQDQIAYVYQGAMAKMDSLAPRTTMAFKAKRVHIMTGRPDHYLRLLSLLKGKRKKIGLDPAQEIHHVWDAQRFRQALSQTDILFGNENEVRTAQRYLKVRSRRDLLDHVPMLVRTKGAKGSEILTAEESITIPAIPPRKMIDPTGAGDTFRAGFYAALYRNYGLREAGVIAASSSSFALEAEGALSNVPAWEQVLERARPYL